MVSLSNRLGFMMDGRAVRRYHTAHVLDHQRIDAHSWGVAMVIMLLLPDETMRRAALIEAALVHDLAEQQWGDIPAPTKRALPTEMRSRLSQLEDDELAANGFHVNLTTAEKRLLKIADAADGALHCIVERRMGNAMVTSVFQNFWTYLTEEQAIGELVVDTQVAEQELKECIQMAWMRAAGVTV
tara:strand:+ start:1657 stop:2211 length:555 start_codon:yes stop_codon:yes gene_type:complete